MDFWRKDSRLPIETVIGKTGYEKLTLECTSKPIKPLKVEMKTVRVHIRPDKVSKDNINTLMKKSMEAYNYAVDEINKSYNENDEKTSHLYSL
jgi:hypothetical protein